MTIKLLFETDYFQARGAITGAVTGAVGAKLYGGNIWRGATMGAITGAASAGVSYGLTVGFSKGAVILAEGQNENINPDEYEVTSDTMSDALKIEEDELGNLIDRPDVQKKITLSKMNSMRMKRDSTQKELSYLLTDDDQWVETYGSPERVDFSKMLEKDIVNGKAKYRLTGYGLNDNEVSAKGKYVKLMIHSHGNSGPSGVDISTAQRTQIWDIVTTRKDVYSIYTTGNWRQR